MRILFEDYHYSKEAVPSLEGIDLIELQNGKVKLSYVGYLDAINPKILFVFRDQTHLYHLNIKILFLVCLLGCISP